MVTLDEVKMSPYILVSLVFFFLPGGKDWRIVKDARARCQVLVPPDWSGGTSVATAPDHRAGAVVHGLPREQRFEQAVSAAKEIMKPISTIEEGPARVWYAYDGGVQGTTFWYVAVLGDPVCTAQVQFKDRELEATARAIAGSLAVVH
jgi:hypothetical protein